MTYRVTHLQFDYFDMEDDVNGDDMREYLQKAKSMLFEANSREELETEIHYKVAAFNIIELEYEEV